MVRKVIFTILSIIVLVCAGVWGFLYYKRVQSFNIEVPVQAARVVRLNMEQMGRALLFSSGGAKEASVKRKGSRKYGLDLPFNVFLFGMQGLPSDCLFSKWEIRKPTDFEAFLKADFIHSGPVWVHRSKLFSCIYDQHAAVMMTVSMPDEAMLQAANAYLQGQHTQAFAQSKWSGIRNAAADIAIDGDWGSGGLYFKQGSVSASWFRKDTITHRTVPAAPEGIALSIHSGSNLVDGVSSLLKGRTDSVPWDQLHSAFKDGFTFYINGSLSQEEQVITYDYDENFEKVATVSLQEKQVPGVYLNTTLAGPDQLKILQEEAILLPPDSVNKSIFPLFMLQYQVSPSSGRLLISSASQPGLYQPESNPNLSMGLCLSLWCNVVQLRSLPVFTDAAGYLKPFKTLKITGKQDKGVTQYELNLNFTDPQQYALRQVLDLF